MFGYYLREKTNGDKSCEVRHEVTGFFLREVSLDKSLDIYRHSPDGFNWGYDCSGCSQLALAILFDFTNDESIAIKYYKPFRQCFISEAKTDDIISNASIQTFLSQISDKIGKPLIGTVRKG